MVTTQPFGWLQRLHGRGPRGHVLAAFCLMMGLVTSGGMARTADSSPPAVPSESVTVVQTVLCPGTMVFQVRNDGAQPVTIAQVSVNDAYWPFTARPSTTLVPRATAFVTLSYPWDTGAAYEVQFVTSTGATYVTDVDATTTSAASSVQVQSSPGGMMMASGHSTIVIHNDPRTAVVGRTERFSALLSGQPHTLLIYILRYPDGHTERIPVRSDGHGYSSHAFRVQPHAMRRFREVATLSIEDASGRVLAFTRFAIQSPDRKPLAPLQRPSGGQRNHRRPGLRHAPHLCHVPDAECGAGHRPPPAWPCLAPVATPAGSAARHPAG